MSLRFTFCCVIFLSMASVNAQSLVTVDTVLIGNPGNASANSSNASSWGSGYGVGAVDYTYAIGTTEVTISQYASFLNATAASDPYGLYNLEMGSNGNVAGISRTGSSGSYSYAVIGAGDRPITFVSWYDAARFTNWLANGATAGASTETGTYSLNGATSGIFMANPGSTFWLPTADEWAKAAFFNPTTGNYSLYATQSNTLTSNVIGSNGANVNTGVYATSQSASYSSSANYLTEVGAYATASFYGTYDQTGGVFEWNDTVYGGTTKGLRGGSWYFEAWDARAPSFGVNFPSVENFNLGFRVATVPEPAAATLLLLGPLVCLRRNRASRT